MIKQIHKLLLLITATFFTANVHAVELDGIYYYLNTTDKTACVTSNGDWAHPLSKYTGNITIPETITYNGSNYSVTSISNGAFYCCKNMISVDIPISVTSIGKYAFQGCSGLTSINIPPSVTSIEYATFSSCSGLTSINIPSSVTSIETHAFSYCSGLTSINIPSSVTNIGSSAFAGCSGLTTINIPSSVTNIGSSAFAYCSGLTSINVSIDNPMYKSINGILYNKDQTILLVYPAGKIGPFTIPSSVTKIESSMFYGCSGLTSISIPSSVTSIGSNAFSGCSKLTSIDVSPGNSMYNSTNGVLCI